MIRIGLLSDTHGFYDPRLSTFFRECDEIWHAGDIGNIATANVIMNEKALKAVYGNIDGAEVRKSFPGEQRFHCDRVEVWITHIGGYPGHYDRRIRDRILLAPPDLFICGHSHILKVMHDKDLGLLHINPGAAGRTGIHKVRTAVRFSISEKRIFDLEVWEAPR